MATDRTTELLHLSVTRETAAQIGSAAAMCLHSPILADPSYPYPLPEDDRTWLQATLGAVAAMEGKPLPRAAAPVTVRPSSVPGLVLVQVPPAGVPPLARAATLANLTGDVPGLHARAQHALISLGDDNQLYPRIPLEGEVGTTILKLMFRYRNLYASKGETATMQELTALVAPAVIAEYLALTDPIVISKLGDVIITLRDSADWPRSGASPDVMLDWLTAAEMTALETFSPFKES